MLRYRSPENAANVREAIKNLHHIGTEALDLAEELYRMIWVSVRDLWFMVAERIIHFPGNTSNNMNSYKCITCMHLRMYS